MRALRNGLLVSFAVVAIGASVARAAPAGGRTDCWEGVGIYSDPVFSSDIDAQQTGDSLSCDWICYAAFCDTAGIYFLGYGCESFCHGEGYPPNVQTYETTGMWGFVTGLCYCHDIPAPEGH